MNEECRHAHIRTWVGQDDGKPAGLWSCADCGHKFVPLYIAQETDAKRYRWLAKEHGWWLLMHFPAKRIYVDASEVIDEAIDAAMGAA